jgi:hypothetical protein
MPSYLDIIETLTTLLGKKSNQYYKDIALRNSKEVSDTKNHV